MQRPDPVPALSRLALIQADPGQPAALLRGVDIALAEAVGHRLCTIQVHDPAADEAERVYSNHPALYPVGQRKAASKAPRMRELMDHGRPVLVQDEAALKRSYPDHEGLLVLGCGSAVNTPVRWQGRTLGQVNLMHQAGWYHDSDLGLIRVFAQFLVPVFLAMQPAQGGTRR
jgi:hypothetical protein